MNEQLNDLVQFLFTPPPTPDIDLPLFARAAGVAKAIEAACRAAYFAGVQDGLLWGFVAAMIVVHVLPRLNIVKSLNNVISWI